MASDIEDYLHKRLDLPASVCRRIVWALREYIILTLFDKRQAYIRGLGTFKLTINPKGRQVTFRPTDELYRHMNDVSKSTGKDLAATSVSSKINQILVKRNARLNEELDTPQADSSSKASFIRLSLLKYLQQEFPYGGSWEHPTTKRVFNHQEVTNALLVFKEQVSEQTYWLFWSMWVGLSNRVGIAKKLRASSRTVRLKWDRAADSIIFLMEYNHLHPSELSIFTKSLDELLQ